jgi:hypothetical protein
MFDLIEDSRILTVSLLILSQCHLPYNFWKIPLYIYDKMGGKTESYI